MITRQLPVDLTMQYPLEKEYDLNRIVFFDIETTGFSADTSFLYLIGCIYYEASSFHMIQWFSEGIKEEAELLTAFFTFLENYDLIIHFNGTGFDIPYLLRKCIRLNLDYNFDFIDFIDLYKKISPLKKILKLANYRQKTLEGFLRIDREDTFSGGDLIEVYQSYLGKKHLETLKYKHHPKEATDTSTESDLLLYQLLLHNEDDIKGLVKLCSLLSYSDLLDKPFRVLQAFVSGTKLTIHCELTNSLPVSIGYRHGLVQFTADKTTMTFLIEIYEGELKYYYDNYKDYYYLPAEDRSIHKSVAQFVEKEFKVKAKPSNCYTRKSGSFAPQFDAVISPYFRQNNKDSMTFLEIHTDFLLQEDNLARYVTHLLNYLVTSKEK